MSHYKQVSLSPNQTDRAREAPMRRLMNGRLMKDMGREILKWFDLADVVSWMTIGKVCRNMIFEQVGFIPKSELPPQLPQVICQKYLNQKSPNSFANLVSVLLKWLPSDRGDKMTADVIANYVISQLRAEENGPPILSTYKGIPSIIAKIPTYTSAQCSFIARILSQISCSRAGINWLRKEALIRGMLVMLGNHNNTPEGRQEIARAIGNIAHSNSGIRGLIQDNEIREVLIILGNQENTAKGRQYISIAIGNIARNNDGATWLIQDDRTRDVLVVLGKKENTSEEQKAIVRAIGNITRENAGITWLIQDDRIISFLVSLPNKGNRSKGNQDKENRLKEQQYIAIAIGNIARLDEGRKRLIQAEGIWVLLVVFNITITGFKLR